MSLPKRLYVREDQASDGNKYLIADADLESVTEDSPRTIGVYELKQKLTTWKEIHMKGKTR